MLIPTWRAWLLLIRMDRYLSRDDFGGLYEYVRRTSTRETAAPSVGSICHAVDVASVWYWKQVTCLQRSAAATCLLRQNGHAAELVLGTQSLPFRAHAWVEVGGGVVNDKPYISELYAVIDKC